MFGYTHRTAKAAGAGMTAIIEQGLDVKRIYVQAQKRAVHKATDAHPPFTKEWDKAVALFTYMEFRSMTEPPRQKCDKCGN